jgi:hypothetical protein
MDILLEEHAISSLVFSSLFTFSNSEWIMEVQVCMEEVAEADDS